MEKRFIWAVVKEIMVEDYSDGYHDFFDELDTDVALFDSEEKAIKSKDEELKKTLQLCLEHNIFNEDIIEAVEKYLGITEVENYDEDEDYDNVSFFDEKDCFELQGSDEEENMMIRARVRVVKKTIE